MSSGSRAVSTVRPPASIGLSGRLAPGSVLGVPGTMTACDSRRVSGYGEGVTRPRSQITGLVGLLGFGAAVAVVAVVGALGSAGAGEEYAALEQPGWAPPSWLFSPVWTVLYVTIALAGWLVWRVAGFGPVLLPYAMQLVLNAVWPALFFGASAYGLAAIEVVLLWLAIAGTVAAFWRTHRVAALLFVPYWAWTTYAAALTIAVWWLNR